MAIQKVEFEFPDPDKVEEKTDFEEKADGSFALKVEGRASEEEAKREKAKAKPKDDDLDIEVVDDRPAEDQGVKRAAPKPMDLSDEEMDEYSERVRKRLQHFSKGYHDQRRAAEAASREREEAVRYAQQIAEENRKLKGTVNKNQEAMLESAKKLVVTEHEDAKAKYKQAYESGDADAVLKAQEDLTSAQLKLEKVNNLKIPALQEDEYDVQTQQTAPAQSVDERAVTWQAKNKWFGEDDEMTSFALGLHQKLVKQGVNPRSDDYYEKINSRMRQVFPESFEGEDEYEEVTEEPRRKATVVASATRSVAPKKITLTRTQVALAKKLGVPLEEYAKQAAMELRKQNG
jgi:hypothetical protein